MAEAGYKQLISYRLAKVAFELGWDFVPKYYNKIEDSRQRDQIKQALRSHKQNLVEGSSTKSLSSKIQLYSVSKASGMEALEDCEDILRFEQLPLWQKDDPRLIHLHGIFEYPNPSNSPVPPYPSFKAIQEALGGLEGREGLETVVNYLIDLLKRSGYLIDHQIRSLEEKHRTEGGYRENLLKKRLDYLKQS
jgi:four helix bundle suffix protein